jgi:hypothetical protein
MSRHPVTPMDEADIRLHLAKQTSLPVELVDWLKLKAKRAKSQNANGATNGDHHRSDKGQAKSAIVLFDTLDGRVARMTRTATEIGVQLDSLADVLTFGIAPIALIYAWGIGAVFTEQNSAHYLGVFLLFM